MNDGLKTGWLSPSGDFVPCACREHMYFSMKLCRAFNYLVGRTDEPDDVLLCNGWVKITIFCFVDHGWYFAYEKFLTDFQKNFLRDYFFDSDVPVCEITKRRWRDEFGNEGVPCW